MKPNITPDLLNATAQQTLASHLGIEFIEVGPDFLKAKMPVDARTIQPLGLLHGGASVALAETVGSVACSLRLDPAHQTCVGLEINANHIKSVRSGYVYGTARPIHLGRKTQVWEIKITDEAEELISISRLTMMILDKR